MLMKRQGNSGKPKVANSARPTHEEKRILKDEKAGLYYSVDSVELREELVNAARNTRRESKREGPPEPAK